MKRSLSFRLAVAIAAIGDRFQGRALAINDGPLVPFETSRGTESLTPDVVISFRDAVIMSGSDDRHCTLPTLATDIPRGTMLNDLVSTGEPGVIRKQCAIFGLYAESLPGVAAGATPAGAELVVDLVTPGRVKALPTAPGTYIVFGRARFTVATAGDPVSIIHCVPRAVVVTA